MLNASRKGRGARASWLAACLCLMTLECIGTSSETENTGGNSTLTGRVVLPDGHPAAGVQVRVQSGKIVCSPCGKPAPKPIDSAVADKQGSFKLAFRDVGGFYLEIRPERLDSQGVVDSFPAVFLKEYRDKTAGVLSLGSLFLMKSGVLTGRLLPKSGIEPKTAWIGVRGSDNFVRADWEGSPDSTASFVLPGVYPGEHALVLIFSDGTLDSLGNSNVTVVDSLAEGTADAGAVTEMGLLQF